MNLLLFRKNLVDYLGDERDNNISVECLLDKIDEDIKKGELITLKNSMLNFLSKEYGNETPKEIDIMLELIDEKIGK